MTTNDTTISIYKDIIGRELFIDSYVVTTHRHDLVIGKIIKFSPKTVRLQQFNSRNTFSKYAYETALLLPVEDVVTFVLSNIKSHN